jgi:hypothetical protein
MRTDPDCLQTLAEEIQLFWYRRLVIRVAYC